MDRSPASPRGRSGGGEGSGCRAPAPPATAGDGLCIAPSSLGCRHDARHLRSPGDPSAGEEPLGREAGPALAVPRAAARSPTVASTGSPCAHVARAAPCRLGSRRPALRTRAPPCGGAGRAVRGAAGADASRGDGHAAGRGRGRARGVAPQAHARRGARARGGEAASRRRGASGPRRSRSLDRRCPQRRRGETRADRGVRPGARPPGARARGVWPGEDCVGRRALRPRGPRRDRCGSGRRPAGRGRRRRRARAGLPRGRPRPPSRARPRGHGSLDPPQRLDVKLHEDLHMDGPCGPASGRPAPTAARRARAQRRAAPPGDPLRPLRGGPGRW